MFHRLRFIVALLALCSTALAHGRVDVTPELLEEWQKYDGWYIRVINFAGVKSFGRSELLNIMATESPSWLRRYVPIGGRGVFDGEEFARDLFRLQHFYQREGFPDAAVSGRLTLDEDDQQLVLEFAVEEGDPMILEAWHMEGGEHAGIDSARWSQKLRIKIGERLALSDIMASEDTLVRRIRINGFARAAADHRITADSARYRASLAFLLTPGDVCYFGTTRITGLKQISEGTVRRELAYDEGDRYTPIKVEDTRENIASLEVFTLTAVRPDTSVPGDTLPVDIETQETRRYRVQASAGYDLRDKQRVQTEFSDLNFFGRGRRLTWSTSYALRRRSTEVRLFWPHTPWQVTDVTLAPKWDFRKDLPGVRLDTRSNTTILSAEPLRKVNVSISNELGSERVRVLLPGNDSTYSILKSVEAVSVGWDTRDNRLIPRRGHFLGATVTESGLFYRTDQRWWRLRLNGSAVQPIAKFLSYATRAEFGVMGPLHDAAVTPLQERFRYGGSNTVRGWDLNELSPRAPEDDDITVGGDVAFYITSEIRRQVWGPVTIAVFVDAGNVWTRPGETQLLDLYPSAGLGLLFITPVGPIRIDHAWQLRPNPYHDTSPQALHFSVGTPF